MIEWGRVREGLRRLANYALSEHDAGIGGINRPQSDRALFSPASAAHSSLFNSGPLHIRRLTSGVIRACCSKLQGALGGSEEETKKTKRKKKSNIEKSKYMHVE